MDNIGQCGSQYEAFPPISRCCGQGSNCQIQGRPQCLKDHVIGQREPGTPNKTEGGYAKNHRAKPVEQEQNKKILTTDLCHEFHGLLLEKNMESLYHIQCLKLIHFINSRKI